jgi:hypothetical protein
MPRRLTVADVCAVTGYARDELHATLRVLWPYNEFRSAPRVAREFSAQDLVVLSVTQAIEHRFGLRRSALARLGEPLRAALSGPKVVSRKARLVISVEPPGVEYVNAAITEREGLVVALGPIFERVDGYLTFDGQGLLPLTEIISGTEAKSG